MTKWEFIISNPHAKQLIAEELAYAYMTALRNAADASIEEIKFAAKSSEVYEKAKESYLQELNSLKTDYLGVIA